MKEIDIQSQIVETANVFGYGQKLSNGFLAGVPDLLIKHCNFDTCILEVKFIKAKDVPKMPTTLMPKRPTKLQYNRLKAMQEGGIFCGWILVVESSIYLSPYSIWVGSCTDPAPNVSLFEDECIYKLRGQPWPLDLILTRLQKRIADD